MDWSTRDIPAFVYADTTWKIENLAVTCESRYNLVQVNPPCGNYGSVLLRWEEIVLPLIH